MITFNQTPAAYALLAGNDTYPNAKGKVELYDVYDGTVVVVEAYGLDVELEKVNRGFWGFHVHEDSGHYNPNSVQHPEHTGDLPSLLSQDGVAWMAVYTKRFYPEEVIGKMMVLHAMADDFKSQPSGSAGEMIAFGEIVAWDREIR